MTDRIAVASIPAQHNDRCIHCILDLILCRNAEVARLWCLLLIQVAVMWGLDEGAIVDILPLIPVDLNRRDLVGVTVWVALFDREDPERLWKTEACIDLLQREVSELREVIGKVAI